MTIPTLKQLYRNVILLPDNDEYTLVVSTIASVSGYETMVGEDWGGDDGELAERETEGSASAEAAEATHRAMVEKYRPHTCPICEGDAFASGIDSLGRDADWECGTCGGVGYLHTFELALYADEIRRHLEERALAAYYATPKGREDARAYDAAQAPF